jgi:UDP-glucose:tetrahydrobiopterin glucosyltransferase
LPELIDAATGRLAAAGDVAGLARAVAAATALSRRACRARAEAIGDLERMVDRYESLYRRLASPSDAEAEVIAA